MAITINGSGTVTGLSVGGLPDGTVDSGTLATDSVTAVKIPDTVESSLKSGRKNLIINGDFRVSQRGDYTASTTMTHNVYMLDRWKNYAGVTSTIQDLGGYVEIKATAASGASTIRLSQLVEDLYQLEGQVVTVSCEMKSNSINGRLQMHNGSWVATSAAHTGGGDWENLSFTTTMSSSLTTTAIYAGIDGVSSADVAIAIGDYCQIKNVQLELGSVATDFEHRSYGEELALCQRYYWTESQSDSYHNVCTGFYPNTTLFIGVVHTPVAMRLSPSLITSGNWETAGNGSSTVSAFLLTDSTGSDLTCFQIRATVSNVTTGQGASLRNATDTTAIIALDAEL
jgi:hypothetical protein